MTTNDPIKLYILTGFLGSGKTTLLNNLLDYLSERGQKAGVIVNEWGQVPVDGSLVHNNGIEIRELNNGQVFCSCLAPKFVQALVAFAAYPIKYLLVETSGLANPVSLENVLSSLRELTGVRYDYRGMVALVDPENFLDLVGTVNAVEEQVISSQMIIINKMDLVDKGTLGQVEEKVKSLNPSAPIFHTCFSKVDAGIFELELRKSKGTHNEDVARNVKIPYKRAAHYVVTTEERVVPAKVAVFAKRLLPDAFRIKGFICSPEGWQYLDGVNGKVELKPVDYQGEKTQIVIISRVWEEIIPRIEAAWKEVCGVPYQLK